MHLCRQAAHCGPQMNVWTYHKNRPGQRCRSVGADAQQRRRRRGEATCVGEILDRAVPHPGDFFQHLLLQGCTRALQGKHWEHEYQY